MDKLIVRGTEINVQWDLKRDDFLNSMRLEVKQG